MVSIRKYMEMREHRKSEQAESPGAPILAGLCAAILDQIGAYVAGGSAGGEVATQFRARIESAKAQLGCAAAAQTAAPITEEQAVSIAESVRLALAAGAARERESAQRTAIETQHVVGVLNHALMVLAGGNERSVSRLMLIQSSLQRTALQRDNNGLRASLGDALKLIREEAAREQEHGERDLAEFEAQVIRVREHFAANPVRRLPGRADGAQALADGLSDRPAGTTLYVAAFSVEQIRALVQRYGPDPVEEIFFQIIRERVQPLSPGCASWRWSSGCIVSLFEYPAGLADLQKKLTGLCRAPVVYRMTLGSRTAVLKVAVSHMLIAVDGIPDPRPAETLRALMSQLDRFAGVEATHAA